jgi:plasmid stabilization system protein ParE
VAELDAARQYLDAQSPQLGRRFLDEVTAAFDAIVLRPLSFAKLETLAPEHPYRRALLATYRYAVIFECVDDDIIVVAIAHASREPNYWLGRPARDDAAG